MLSNIVTWAFVQIVLLLVALRLFVEIESSIDRTIKIQRTRAAIGTFRLFNTNILFGVRLQFVVASV